MFDLPPLNKFAMSYLCPLCCSAKTFEFAKDASRAYHRCAECELVFVPAKFHLSLAQEKEQYDLHRNIDEPGYRNFLERVFNPLIDRLPAEAQGLDFGCGPGPVLATMFKERGHAMALHDQFYFPDVNVLQQDYDFITATEVFEHLQHPQKIIDLLWSCLRSGGTLAVMTKLVTNQVAFAQWHYKTDPTHIIFFSTKTFRWLAESLHADVEFFGKDVIFLHKKKSGRTE